MKKILITGKGDKRIISYPFMFYASQTGKSCVVTDDINYQRLFAGYGMEGEIDGVKIMIHPFFGAEEDLTPVMTELESSGFDSAIFVIDAHETDPVFDRVIVAAHVINTFLGTDIEEVVSEHPNTSAVCLATTKPELEKNIPVFTYQPSDFAYIYTVEEKRKLAPPGKRLAALLQPMITGSLPELPTSTYNMFAEKGGIK